MVSAKKDLEIFVSICANAFSALLAALSSFLPGWRIGGGSTHLYTGGFRTFLSYLPISFDTRYYGLIQLKGAYSQTVSGLASQTCDHTLLTFSQAPLLAIDDEKECLYTTATQCPQTLHEMMQNRCKNYQILAIASHLVLICTFVCVLMLIGATMVALLTRIQVTGSVIVGLYAFASIILLAVNIVYAIMSDVAFRDLRNNQTYPYPQLHYAYYMHLSAILILLVSTSVFYWKVMPRVRSYDPEEEKQRKKERRLNKYRRPVEATQAQTPSPFCNLRTTDSQPTQPSSAPRHHHRPEHARGGMHPPCAPLPYGPNIPPWENHAIPHRPPSGYGASVPQQLASGYGSPAPHHPTSSFGQSVPRMPQSGYAPSASQNPSSGYVSSSPHLSRADYGPTAAPHPPTNWDAPQFQPSHSRYGAPQSMNLPGESVYNAETGHVRGTHRDWKRAQVTGYPQSLD